MKAASIVQVRDDTKTAIHQREALLRHFLRRFAPGEHKILQFGKITIYPATTPRRYFKPGAHYVQNRIESNCFSAVNILHY
jgi:hypothetical protein